MTGDELFGARELESLAAVRARVAGVTPARLLVGRAGTSYSTRTLLTLRADHAAARDAVTAPLDLEDGPLAAALRDVGALVVSSRARTLQEHLRRPDLGRLLDEDDRGLVRDRCPADVDLQVVVGDGLSAAAVAVHVPVVLPALLAAARDAGWSVGLPVLVRRCRVGVLNDVGEVLRPRAAVLLVGERPGLAYAESLSAYVAWRPGPGQTDADRVVLSGISAGHRQGLPAHRAAEAVLAAVASRLSPERRPGLQGGPTSSAGRPAR
ncbi:ethanolamine ammonia-lyase small subunit [Motilibacter peucedani]|uniref:Ethanolamine ammonia-lyase small subunit n=1 Tax=Motilibacter peucedani TaxID=598650 RepID=A0A420XJZ4_9ACTN|nr:ethanolamine ammonia-lyase light chain EutC [Motilibacter peucedani]RKS67953.1 ethanolamine ammonia-lyase small subunit [Motilibacter peucedani]